MKTAELREKTIEELRALLATAHQELNDSKKLLAANELANLRVITKARKEIAKLNTIIAEIENNDKEEA